MGGVVIAERHADAGAEHERMLRKQDAGCEFFISQVCYDLDHTRNLLSDYAYGCRDLGLDPRPVVLTLAACGSVKTLQFMSWLGIEVPGWAAGRDHAVRGPADGVVRAMRRQRPAPHRLLPPPRPAVRDQRREPH